MWFSRILLAAVLCLVPTLSWAAITATSNKCKADGAAGATSIACTMPGNTTAGNFIACGVSAENGTESNFSSISDGTTSGTRRPATWGAYSATQGGVIFDIQNITAKTTPTITASLAGSYAFRGIVCQEFSGLATSNAYDVGTVQVQSGPGTGANAVSSGSTAATAQASELLFGCSVDATGIATFTAGTSYTLIDQNGTNLYQACEYRVVSATSTYAATFTASQNDDFITHIATYKEAAAAAAAQTRMLLGVGN